MEALIEDILRIRSSLPKLHKNLFFKKRDEDFFNELDRLIACVHEMDIYEIRIEIAKIIASLGDAHTSVNLPVNLLCPIELYWFSEGIYIIRTSPEYEKLLFARVTHISGMEISQVTELLSGVISYENTYLLHALLPKYLPAIELLYDLNIADNVEKLELQCTLASGENSTVEIGSLKPSEARQMLSKSDDKIQSRLPLYRRNCNQLYWFEYLDEYETLFFQYNACREMDEMDFKSFHGRLTNDIAVKKPKKLVVDIRNNRGGDSSILDAFIEEIIGNPVLNRRGALFVIVGRDTFSSALLNAYTFKDRTEAIIVGEPTGGNLNCYGEVQRMHLEKLNLVISYSTKYYRLLKNDLEAPLIPDVLCIPSINDFMNNIDPCMDYIIGTTDYCINCC